MSWDKFNLFNLSRYSRQGPEREMNKTTFQLRFRAKQLSVPYHAGHVTQKAFRRNQRRVLPRVGAGSEASTKPGSVPLPVPPTTMLTFGFMERRADVAIFRACFVPSIWEARHLCRKGYVKVNGKDINSPGYVLEDGDIIQVDPSRLSLLRPKTAKALADEAENGDDKAAEASNDEKKTEAIVKFKPKEDYGLKPAPYMAPWIFVPEYLEVNYNNCTICFLREPSVAPGKCEIPSPYDEVVHQRTFDYYQSYRKL